MNKNFYAWIDLETTGLNADKGHILEIACIITEDDLKPIASFSRAIELPLYLKYFPSLAMDGFVLNMHTKNGLLQEIRSNSAVSLMQARVDFYDFLSQFKNKKVKLDNGDTEYTNLYFVGNSIAALDLPYLRKHMPEIMELVHYRSLDITGLRLGLELMNKKPNSFYVTAATGNHRAMDDVIACIKQLEFYKTKLFNSL